MPTIYSDSYWDVYAFSIDYMLYQTVVGGVLQGYSSAVPYVTTLDQMGDIPWSKVIINDILQNYYLRSVSFSPSGKVIAAPLYSIDDYHEPFTLIVLDSLDGHVISTSRPNSPSFYRTRVPQQQTLFVSEGQWYASFVNHENVWHMIGIDIFANSIIDHYSLEGGQAGQLEFDGDSTLTIVSAWSDEESELTYPAVTSFDLYSREFINHLAFETSLRSDIDIMYELKFTATSPTSGVLASIVDNNQLRFICYSDEENYSKGFTINFSYEQEYFDYFAPATVSSVAWLNDNDLIISESHYDYWRPKYDYPDAYDTNLVRITFDSNMEVIGVHTKMIYEIYSPPTMILWTKYCPSCSGSNAAGFFLVNDYQFKSQYNYFQNDFISSFISYTETSQWQTTCYSKNTNPFTLTIATLEPIDIPFCDEVDDFVEDLNHLALGRMKSEFEISQVMYFETIEANLDSLGSPCNSEVLPFMACPDCSGYVGDVSYTYYDFIEIQQSEYVFELTYIDGTPADNYFSYDADLQQIIPKDSIPQGDYLVVLSATFNGDGTTGYTQWMYSSYPLSLSCDVPKVKDHVTVAAGIPFMYNLDDITYQYKDGSKAEVSLSCTNCDTDPAASFDSSKNTFTYSTNDNEGLWHSFPEFNFQAKDKSNPSVKSRGGSKDFHIKFYPEIIGLVTNEHQHYEQSIQIDPLNSITKIPNEKYMPIQKDLSLTFTLTNDDGTPVPQFISYDGSEQALIVSKADNIGLENGEVTLQLTVAVSITGFDFEEATSEIHYCVTIKPMTIHLPEQLFVPSSTFLYNQAMGEASIQISQLFSSFGIVELDYEFSPTTGSCSCISVQLSNSKVTVNTPSLGLTQQLTYTIIFTPKINALNIQAAPQSLTIILLPISQIDVPSDFNYYLHTPIQFFYFKAVGSSTYKPQWSIDGTNWISTLADTPFSYTNGDSKVGVRTDASNILHYQVRIQQNGPSGSITYSSVVAVHILVPHIFVPQIEDFHFQTYANKQNKVVDVPTFSTEIGPQSLHLAPYQLLIDGVEAKLESNLISFSSNGVQNSFTIYDTQVLKDTEVEFQVKVDYGFASDAYFEILSIKGIFHTSEFAVPPGFKFFDDTEVVVVILQEEKTTIQLHIPPLNDPNIQTVEYYLIYHYIDSSDITYNDYFEDGYWNEAQIMEEYDPEDEYPPLFTYISLGNGQIEIKVSPIDDWDVGTYMLHGEAYLPNDEVNYSTLLQVNVVDGYVYADSDYNYFIPYMEYSGPLEKTIDLFESSNPNLLEFNFEVFYCDNEISDVTCNNVTDTQEFITFDQLDNQPLHAVIDADKSTDAGYYLLGVSANIGYTWYGDYNQYYKDWFVYLIDVQAPVLSLPITPMYSPIIYAINQPQFAFSTPPFEITEDINDYEVVVSFEKLGSDGNWISLTQAPASVVGVTTNSDTSVGFQVHSILNNEMAKYRITVTATNSLFDPTPISFQFLLYIQTSTIFAPTPAFDVMPVLPNYPIFYTIGAPMLHINVNQAYTTFPQNIPLTFSAYDQQGYTQIPVTALTQPVKYIQSGSSGYLEVYSNYETDQGVKHIYLEAAMADGTIDIHSRLDICLISIEWEEDVFFEEYPEDGEIIFNYNVWDYEYYAFVNFIEIENDLDMYYYLWVTLDDGTELDEIPHTPIKFNFQDYFGTYELDIFSQNLNTIRTYNLKLGVYEWETDTLLDEKPFTVNILPPIPIGVPDSLIDWDYTDWDQTYKIYDNQVLVPLMWFEDNENTNYNYPVADWEIYKDDVLVESPSFFFDEYWFTLVIQTNDSAEVGNYEFVLYQSYKDEESSTQSLTFEFEIQNAIINVPEGEFFIDQASSEIDYLVSSEAMEITVTEYETSAPDGTMLSYSLTMTDDETGLETELSDPFSFDSCSRTLTINTEDTSLIGKSYTFTIVVSLPNGYSNSDNSFTVNLISFAAPPTSVIKSGDVVSDYYLLSPERTFELNPWETNDPNLVITYTIEQLYSEQTGVETNPILFDEETLTGTIYSDDVYTTNINSRNFKITATWGHNMEQSVEFTISLNFKVPVVQGPTSYYTYSYTLFENAVMTNTVPISTSPAGSQLQYIIQPNQNYQITFNPTQNPNQFTFYSSSYFTTSQISVNVIANIVGLKHPTGQIAYTMKITLLPYTITPPSQIATQLYNFMLGETPLSIPVGSYATSLPQVALSYSLIAFDTQLASIAQSVFSHFASLQTSNGLSIIINANSVTYIGKYKLCVTARKGNDLISDSSICTWVIISSNNKNYQIVVPTPSTTTFTLGQADANKVWTIPTFTTIPSGGYFSSITATLSNGISLPPNIQITAGASNIQISVSRIDSATYGNYQIRFTALLNTGLVSQTFLISVNIVQDNVYVVAPTQKIANSYEYNMGDSPLVIQVPLYSTRDNGVSASSIQYELLSFPSMQPLVGPAVPGYIKIVRYGNSVQIQVFQNAGPTDSYNVVLCAYVMGYDGSKRSDTSMMTTINVISSIIPPNLESLQSILQEFSLGTSVQQQQWFNDFFGISHGRRLQSSVPTLPYTQYTCTAVGVCPDGTLKNTCSWNQFFAVTYLAPGFRSTNPQFNYFDFPYNNANANILICTNSLPSHCYYEPATAPYFNTDHTKGFACMSVAFNVHPGDLQIQTPVQSSMTVAQVNNTLCSATKAANSNIDQRLYQKEAVFGMSSLDMKKVVGIAMNGVFIYSATAETGYDVVYPNKTISKWQASLDLCMGTVGQGNVYHYYTFSPCFYTRYASPLNSVADKCSNNAQCIKDPLAFAEAYNPPDVITETPIGIAKDGRIIYNLYKPSGETYQPCEVDICNGRYRDNGEYSYVTTMFFPYTVGCWGPGAVTGTNPSCTSRPRKCMMSSDSRVLSFSMLAVAIGFLVALFA